MDQAVEEMCKLASSRQFKNSPKKRVSGAINKPPNLHTFYGQGMIKPPGSQGQNRNDDYGIVEKMAQGSWVVERE